MYTIAHILKYTCTIVIVSYLLNSKATPPPSSTPQLTSPVADQYRLQ